MAEYYSIGKISKECNVTIKTLRYYDDIKLLQPEFRDECTNYRYYTKEQMATLLVIRRLRSLGLCIHDIKDVISNPCLKNFESKVTDCKDEITNNINLLRAKQADCDVVLSKIKKGNSIISNYDESGDYEKNIQIENIKNSTLIYSREIMKNYNNSDISLQRWIDIYEKCTDNGIRMKSSIITTYHAAPLDQFLMKDCDVEFGVLVDNEAEQLNCKNTRDFGGFTACTSYHIGKYSDIINCYVFMLQWINKMSYEVAGPSSDVFIISPLDTCYEDKHVTKVIIPIRKK